MLLVEAFLEVCDLFEDFLVLRFDSIILLLDLLVLVNQLLVLLIKAG